MAHASGRNDRSRDSAHTVVLLADGDRRDGAVTVLLSITGVIVVGLIVGESALRFRRWRFEPMRLRIMYGAFLFNVEATQAITEVHQRVERLAARSFTELFAFYASASGRSIDEIERLFGFQMSWRRMRRVPLVLRNHLRWHVGLVPLELSW